MESGTKRKLEELYLATIKGLEDQRENSLQAVSELRKKITGEGLEWKPLLVTP
ncbi:hypothetical protein [Paenibacillus sp. DMB20]|uniref:hypothetical protein n=1 Tax=Paenibacillus sp. DMB20 TaxID=1642570 RepID=UPI000AA73F64|nr:hypothetical protein [Paenibacillus sp. DMB20]